MDVFKIGFIVFLNCFLKTYASYHWVVTESGKIQAQEGNSGFPLIKPDDLLAFLEQEQRINKIKILYKQLLALKKSIDTQWSKIEEEGDFEKRLYSTDIDCLLGEIPLSKHNLNTEFLDYGQGSRPKMKETFQRVEPDCTIYSDLDFSMRTFPHLETLNKRDNFNLTFDPVPSKTLFNFNIDAMLRHNSSDWTAYNIASLYWRTVGNGSNAIECARRALFFSPRSERYIVLLNLGTLLQDLHSLGEAAIVLHSAVDHDPEQYLTHLALGNVYAVLGDHKRSLTCYNNVLSLNPGNVRALQLKHALLCHKKLESGLLDIHSALQDLLQDIQKRNAMHEEWFHLQNQVNWEKDSKIKELFSITPPAYFSFKTLLQNVEQQAKKLNEEVSKKVSRKNQISRSQQEFETQLKSKSIFHCDAEKCSPNRNLDNFDEGKPLKKTKFLAQDIPDHENKEVGSEFNNVIESQFALKDEMNSIISLIRSNYEQKINFKNPSEEQINFRKTLDVLKEDGRLSVDQSLFSNIMGACGKDTKDIKKLN